MLRSMTGFASSDIVIETPEGWTASWDVRGVNSKGLDLRLRIPDWIPGLEARLRKLLSTQIGRGSVSVSLRISRVETGRPAINTDALDAALEQICQVEALASAKGVSLAPTTALDLLRERNITSTQQDLNRDDAEALSASLLSGFEPVLEAFKSARHDEGLALTQVIQRQLTEIEAFLAESTTASNARAEKQKMFVTENMNRIIGSIEADPDRIAQELALIAVKSDITEELDRLNAHCVAAHALIAQTGPVGRKFDFLCQEFNREANTLCAKSGDPDLTRIGLGLKTVIDQLREQIQNVE